MARARRDLLGPTRIDGLRAIVHRAWKTGFTVSSNLAKDQAALVAMAASMQLISTRVTSTVYSREWQVTGKGLRWLNETEVEE